MQRVWTRTVRANPRGRDLVVGDVHGCFRTLGRALAEGQSVRFEVERGPKGLQARNVSPVA